MEIAHMCIYLQNTSAHEVLSWQPQIFYIFKSYFFFHIYDQLWIPSWADIISSSLFVPISFEIIHTSVYTIY